jgi:hypothetical protein
MGRERNKLSADISQKTDDTVLNINAHTVHTNGASQAVCAKQQWPRILIFFFSMTPRAIINTLLRPLSAFKGGCKQQSGALCMYSFGMRFHT